jgi:epoxyqueuosine reductase
MAYLGDPRRADPRRVLPECKSILVLAARYPAPGREAESASPTGTPRVAAYARGQDYHLVLAERLKALVAFLEARIGGPVAHRLYTDTGPLLERDLAQRAGLGWIGKNTCLIHPRLGSYFFLAEILLDVELEPDTPFASDRCGTCTRCLDACPTGCILPDRTIDARRCISFLTIENKSAIPAELRPQLDGWAFGCDICQMVCPWNRKPASDPEPLTDFQPDPGLAPGATDLTITAEEFNVRFRSSPLLRARRRGLLRNLCVALGNTAGREALPFLRSLLLTGEPLVQEHATWAIERIETKMGA